MTWREAVIVGCSCGVTLGVVVALYVEFESWRLSNRDSSWAAECSDDGRVSEGTQDQ